MHGFVTILDFHMAKRLIKYLILANCLVVAAIVGSAITAFFCYKHWQQTRYVLESTTLREVYPTKGKPLEFFTKLFEREIRDQNKGALEFVFYSEELKSRMPIYDIHVQGTLFFALTALEHTYKCHFEFAEHSIIVRQK
jgi:hypothetical protein